MSTIYKITVRNTAPAGDSKPFMLFVDQPKFVGRSVPNVWSNVFMQSQSIRGPHGSVSFTFSKDFYAVCGSTTRVLSSDSIVETTNYEEIKLDGKSVVLLEDSAEANEAPSVTATVDATAAGNITPGAFAYLTGKDIVSNDPRHIFIGLGAKDANNNVVPIATITPEPKIQYMITPQNSYYINSGVNVVGKIMDFAATVRESAKVDFTGRVEKAAIVTIDENNNWNIQYVAN